MAHDEITDHYSALARAADAGRTLTGTAGHDDLEGLPQAAVRAALGCGNPVAVAEPRAGETVLDLGSGGGLDVLLSARRVGPDGKAYGVDASADMLALARRNAQQAGAHNAEFLPGTIERLPLQDRSVDVVISNCVINLSSDKAAVLAEAFRVLRPGGRFGVSDVVTTHTTTTEQRTGCAAGALPVGEYRDLLAAAGFTGVHITLTTGHDDGTHSAIVQAAKPAAPPHMELRPMRAADAGQVLAVYQAGLDSGHASFETTAPSWEDFTAARLPGLRYVACDTRTGQVLGWVAASPVSSRCVYAGVVEHSIYVHPRHQAQGIGRALLTAFVAASEDAGIWTVQSGVFPENTASLALHQALGFRVVGTRERIGCHHGLWRDVLLIERRSTFRKPHREAP
jgi:L-amino acid N-acyltransferase YncA/2-polyprenyl-3-methyl-5-hydroxy-6-metoxy-1,4-benzoquinol methylase